MELQDEIKLMMNPQDGEENDDGRQGEGIEGQGVEGEGEQGQQGEGLLEGGTEAGESEGGASASTEQPEETAEQRYARLLEELNTAQRRILELEAGQGGVQPQGTISIPPVQSEPGVPWPPAPTGSRRPEFKLDLEKLKDGLIEDDAEAVGQVLQGFVDYANQLADYTREHTLLLIPDMADKIATQKVNLTIAAHEFYRANPDLQEHRGICGMVMNEVVTENPNLTLAEAFKETETRTRKKLGIKRKIQEADLDDSRANPAFAKRSGTRKPGAPQLTGVRADIAAMMKAAGR